MSLKSDIEAQFIRAMKAKEAEVVSALRMLRAAIKNAEIDKGNKDEGFGDDEVVEVVSRELKKLKDSLQDFEKAGRSDLIGKTEKEIALLEAFMPERIPEEELKALAAAKIAELGASGKADFGKVMGAVMKEVKGRAEGSEVGKIIHTLL
jgi:hypothetical protein